MEGGVDPGEDLRSPDEVSGVHHPDVRRHRWILSPLVVFFLPPVRAETREREREERDFEEFKNEARERERGVRVRPKRRVGSRGYYMNAMVIERRPIVL